MMSVNPLFLELSCWFTGGEILQS